MFLYVLRSTHTPTAFLFLDHIEKNPHRLRVFIFFTKLNWFINVFF